MSTALKELKFSRLHVKEGFWTKCVRMNNLKVMEHETSTTQPHTRIENKKIKTIEEQVYFGPDGFGSMQETLRDTKNFYDAIIYEDVRGWTSTKDFGQEPKQRVLRIAVLRKSCRKNINVIHLH